MHTHDASMQRIRPRASMCEASGDLERGSSRRGRGGGRKKGGRRRWTAREERGSMRKGGKRQDRETDGREVQRTLPRPARPPTATATATLANRREIAPETWCNTRVRKDTHKERRRRRARKGSRRRRTGGLLTRSYLSWTRGKGNRGRRKFISPIGIIGNFSHHVENSSNLFWHLRVV